MNVLHVLDVSWPIQRGYSIRGYYIVTHQKRDGLSPVVLTSEKQYDQNIEQTIEDIRYFRTSKGNQWPGGLPFLREIFQIVRLKRRIADIALTEKIDLIHVHSPSLWGLAALYANKNLKKRLVYEIRAFWEDAAVDSGKMSEDSIKYSISKRVETYLCRKADRLVAICDGIKNDLVSRNISEEKITVVPNGIDLEKFRPVPKSRRLVKFYDLKDRTVLGFIGSMFNFEGLEVLLRAVKKIQDMSDKIRVVLVGEGEKFNSTKKLVGEFGLQDMVIVAGKVPHQEVNEYYSVVDILTYPRISKRITELVTPLKPLEAMAMGKAVIASDVGGLKELIPDDRYGVLFRSGDVDDLANKIRMLVSSPEKVQAIGASAMKMMGAERDWSKLIRIYKQEVYRMA